MTVEFHAEGVL